MVCCRARVRAPWVASPTSFTTTMSCYLSRSGSNVRSVRFDMRFTLGLLCSCALYKNNKHRGIISGRRWDWSPSQTSYISFRTYIGRRLYRSCLQTLTHNMNIASEGWQTNHFAVSLSLPSSPTLHSFTRILTNHFAVGLFPPAGNVPYEHVMISNWFSRGVSRTLLQRTQSKNTGLDTRK